METFVPLYISNKCDSYCSMCNSNCMNKSMRRIEASIEEIENQLHILFDYEKVSAVCILTGELFDPMERLHNIKLVCASINKAFSIGFKKVFFNIGSLQTYEISYIYNHTSCHDSIVLSLFQETYDKKYYLQHFGIHPEHNAKADYQNRLDTIDRWLSFGFFNVDLGILLGFKPIGNDVEELMKHANKCISLGANVYISTPRIKGGQVDDNQYLNILENIHNSIPTAKIIITTREKLNFINNVLDIVSVVSPGSSDICPYNKGDFILNDSSTSQFVIESKRMRPFDVLSSLSYNGCIEYFNP